MNLKTVLSGIFLVSILFASCSGDEEKKAEVKPIVKKVMEPFRFHKAIEVKPGLTLDIVSWGRGSNSIGGYLVLRSDSTHLSYRSIAGELNGKIVLLIEKDEQARVDIDDHEDRLRVVERAI